MPSCGSTTIRRSSAGVPSRCLRRRSSRSCSRARRSPDGASGARATRQWRRPRRREADVERLIIVPTYNESENINTLLDRLLALPFGLEVLVVDDSSPDGTGELVLARQQADPRIHLIRRPGKLGLGSAYVAGFRYGLAAGAQLVFEMDADFSHDA